MGPEPILRPATKADCRRIAELIRLASGGVADWVWATLADDYPGLSGVEIGERRCAREDTAFGYRNCVVAERDGEVVGLLLAYPIEAPAPGARGGGAEGPPSPPPAPDVLTPLNELEAPGTYYVNALAVLPRHRRRGLGTRLLAAARERARGLGLPALSLVAFEQNRDAVRLYERNGFRVVDRRPSVPHELVRYTGDVLLMTAPA